MAFEAVCVADTELQMSLSDLPEASLLDMFRHLDGPTLGRLCLQDRHLRKLASEQSLWQALVLCRWPNCTAEHYKGDWQQLYRHRAVLPPSLCSCIDRLYSLTVQAGGQQLLRVNSSSIGSNESSPNVSPEGSPVACNVYGRSHLPFTRISGMMFDKVMMCLFDLSLLAEQLRSGSSSSSRSSSRAAAVAAEKSRVKQDMAWWLNNKPESVIQCARRSISMSEDWDMWGRGFSCWSDALVRRSALQFLMDLHLDKHGYDVCSSVTDRIQRELDEFDRAMIRIDAERSGCLTTRRPEGLPTQHWWYSLNGLST